MPTAAAARIRAVSTALVPMGRRGTFLDAVAGPALLRALGLDSPGALSWRGERSTSTLEDFSETEAFADVLTRNTDLPAGVGPTLVFLLFVVSASSAD